MEHQAFRYKFTPSEMVYFLFKKKICPRCGSRLIKEKGYITVKGSELNEKEPFFRPDANVKDYKFFFTCEGCRIRYTLTGLAQQNKKG